MKKKGLFRLKRSSDGTVTAEIVNAEGQVEDIRTFGVFSESEFHSLFQRIRQEVPDIEVIEVQFTNN